MAIDILDFLAEQREQASDDLQESILEFETLWERKLWHELTERLLRFFDNPNSSSLQLSFFNDFILSFGDKINPIKLVDLAHKASRQCTELDKRHAFLTKVAKKVDGPNSQDAYVYALVLVARVELEQKDHATARKDLDKAQGILDTFNSFDNVVHAVFYKVNAEYYQATSDYTSFYHNELLYLACEDVASLAEDERRQRAYNLSIAALLSPTIYNFGELLLHPIIESLKQENEWLSKMLYAFNKGDLASYQVLSNRISEHEILKHHQNELRQKIHLAALTEAVFRKAPHDRAMTFSTIADETKVEPDQIEWLLMKALSLGLIRGSVDQVDEVAQINWVQPKVLDMDQVDAMSNRLQEWGGSVNQLGNWIESKGQDVWAV